MTQPTNPYEAPRETSEIDAGEPAVVRFAGGTLAIVAIGLLGGLGVVAVLLELDGFFCRRDRTDRDDGFNLGCRCTCYDVCDAGFKYQLGLEDLLWRFARASNEYCLHTRLHWHFCFF